MVSNVGPFEQLVFAPMFSVVGKTNSPACRHASPMFAAAAISLSEFIGRHSHGPQSACK